ncbi:MAG: Y-family DNA polymerase [Alcaligenaceae bacterium]|nr:Y-family DNA polymerase [Alcaligenaceae bacterium]
MTAFALIDGNCFYCSCERVFNPSLKGKPLIILSNNDGCAISRTDEAKAMGIAMGAPWFQIKHLESRGLVGLSANFPLYGDMSERMMRIISRFATVQEVYSIDESFLDLSGIRQNMTWYGQQIRHQVLRDVGIPTCVGIGPTKTLAKLANYMAKEQTQWNGVCDLTALTRQDLAQAMRNIKVGKVWGVGKKINQRLNSMGISTALDLARLNPEKARKEFSIVLEKTIQELRGTPRITFETDMEPKKQIISSRSFGFPVTSLRQLAHAVSEFTAIACSKLRQQGSMAGGLSVFIRTSPFRPGRQYGASYLVYLNTPSSDTIAHTQAALSALQKLFRPGFNYAKAGVMLLDIEDSQIIQQTLFSVEPEYEKRERLMHTLDAINRQFGRNTLKIAATGIHAKDNWFMRQERKTQGYTTNWNELMVVRA